MKDLSLIPVDDSGDAPEHIAIIMDGNGRWAQARGLPRTAGHKRGAEAVKITIKAACELGIRYLTLFGFSSENWQRPASEIKDLMALLRFYLMNNINELAEEGVRLKVVGDRSRLPQDTVAMINDAESRTQANERLVLTIALSYGSRQELVSAARQLAEDARSGLINPEDITENVFADRLYTRGIPDPDLLIRTSGEQRVSNFLLWQLAYTELVFTETRWPDFGLSDLEHAISEFRRRERRYGTVAG
ncbi:MAG: isoprenyl transferase [Rhodospirillaceae bacterium]|nr:isoprenyl transferase [Rhodospirillaceae bacterium]MBT5564160.1 isoprenyl transferase [Rhodospirillaceae bacterium]MBT6089955.1 isoprenyl transferase [Rhodospirillaceae bacterium]